jgi:hypothetical protein
MKKKIRFLKIAVLAAAMVISTTACSGGKTINSAEALKEYLDSQPANSPAKPIKVAMSANDLNFEEIKEEITSSGKYVNLNLSGSPITSIPGRAFEECVTLAGITIPNSVTSIGWEAFSDCTSLKSVTIGNSVTSIGGGAFYNCTSLRSVTIGNSVTSIGGSAFGNCTSLTSVTFQGVIPSSGLAHQAFNGSGGYIGDLRDKYLAGGKGRYTKPNGESKTWTKK